MKSDPITRRHFFQDCAIGTGKIALASLLADSAMGSTGSSGTHFPAKAKTVIHMFMAGAPSQLELFDNKPMLTRFQGKPHDAR
jgi:hypothetical protein